MSLTPDFEKAVNFTLSYEGGYVNHPADPGGETNFGISKRAYPNLDIKGLTRDKAKEIYKRDYWDVFPMDKLPVGVRIALFDTAVNCGVSRATKLLQRACMVGEDGVIGRTTIAAANLPNVVQSLISERIIFYAGLDGFKLFAKGWVKRCVALAKECL